MLSRRELLLGAVAGGVAAHGLAETRPPAGHDSAAEPTETLELWPGGAPGAPAKAPVETVVERSTDPAERDRAVTGIATPRLVVFRPSTPNGAAMLVTPGGGYQRVVVDKEGYEMGRWFAARGITAFVLFYRLPGEGWADRANAPLADAQRAMRLIRRRAGDYGIDPARVGAMGFSAGGHLSADLATRFAHSAYAPVDAADRLSARPTIAAPIYPVTSMTLPVAHAGSRAMLLGPDPSAATERAHSPQFNVPADAPPHFLLHAEDDGAVTVDNTLELRAALKARNIPVETHLFARGGHGFGLRGTTGKPVSAWPELFLGWAERNGLTGAGAGAGQASGTAAVSVHSR